MPRALIINDVHLADRPPSIRTETYAHDILDKLAYTVKLAHHHKVDVVVFSGDLFHVKAAARTSHWLVQQMCDVIEDYERPVYIVPGNHDMTHDRLESLERQPLGVLFKAGARLLMGADANEPWLFGVPWLQEWDTLGVWMERWRQSDAQLMVAHAPIVPDGETRPYFTIPAGQWALAMGLDRTFGVAYGHMHDPDGVYEALEGRFFCNEGALSRGSIHESTLARRPAVALWDSETGFKRFEVPHRPVEEVFRLAEKETADLSIERLDEFLEKVGSTSLERVSIERVRSDLREKGLRPEVLAEVESCFEEVVS